MITAEAIKKANEAIKTIELKTSKGAKAYACVPARIEAFREICPNGAIITEILSIDDNAVMFKATAYDEEGHILATGHAREEKNATYINKTSFIENCETSAIGRCVGALGLTGSDSIATAEEVANAQAQAQAQQESPKKPPRTAKREANKETPPKAENAPQAKNEPIESKAEEQTPKAEPKQETGAGLKCYKCGNIVKDATAKDGSIWKAGDIAQFATSKYKHVYCADCIKVVNANLKARAERGLNNNA